MGYGPVSDIMSLLVSRWEERQHDLLTPSLPQRNCSRGLGYTNKGASGAQHCGSVFLNL
jgi:hypothetical protein